MAGGLFWLLLIIVAYTYAGYPILLWLLALLTRQAQPSHPPATPTVTLLIAAYNEETVIGKKLDNSLSLNYPRELLQILVAADGSDDGTVDIVRSYADRGVALSYSPSRMGKVAAIDRAIPMAQGEIVIFSDANNLYAPDALLEVVKPFADPGVGAVSGAKLILGEDRALSASEGLYWKYESFIKKQETRLGCCTAVAGEILAIRRALYDSPPPHIINDDFYIAMRIVQRGYRVAYEPKARSYEYVSPSAQDEMERRSRMIAGRYQAMAIALRLLPFRQPRLIWQIVSHKFMRPLVPFAMIGAALANVAAVIWPVRNVAGFVPRLLVLAPPYGWVMLALQAMFYGLALVGGRLGRASKVGKMLYLPAFLVNSNLAALKGFYRFLTGRQSAAWERAQRVEVALPPRVED